MKVLSLQKLSSDDEELLKKAGTVEYLYVPASEITEDPFIRKEAGAITAPAFSSCYLNRIRSKW